MVKQKLIGRDKFWIEKLEILHSQEMNKELSKERTSCAKLPIFIFLMHSYYS